MKSQISNQKSEIANHRCAERTAPLVAPSYDHTSEERAFTACFGAACFLGAILLVVVALVLSWWRG